MNEFARSRVFTWLSRSPSEIAAKLHATDLAFLVAGLERAVEAAVVGLHHRGALVIENGLIAAATQGGYPYRGTVLDRDLSTIERYVLSSCEPPTTVSLLVSNAQHFDSELSERFRSEGLLVGDRERARWIIALPGVAWLMFGGIKVFVGLSRDRPVMNLVLLLGALVVGVVYASRPPRLTSLGSEVTTNATNTSYGLSATAKTAPNQLGGYDMSLAYAIHGSEILVASALTSMLPSYQRALLAAAANSSSSGCSSCGSSCGGGCGGGCGGCT